MKTITYNSPAELKEKTDALLRAHEVATKMQTADLKKYGIPHKKTRYDVHVELPDVAKVCRPGVDPEKLLMAIFQPGTKVRLDAEAAVGVLVLKKKEPVQQGEEKSDDQQ